MYFENEKIKLKIKSYVSLNKAPGGNNYYHHRKTKCPWSGRVISIVAGLRKRVTHSISKAADAEQGR